eukprot:TRINITY_DN49496_c0_g1_i1.p1 TRINITY_DN49496_c0_g1~~TRINITY_DN49496_c0_g1_i1.p1  ORF type:complete len:229 (-),score=40.74 TRINITY_DN49496_c0_g1_i1:44-730(-)
MCIRDRTDCDRYNSQKSSEEKKMKQIQKEVIQDLQLNHKKQSKLYNDLRSYFENKSKSFKKVGLKNSKLSELQYNLVKQIQWRPSKIAKQHGAKIALFYKKIKKTKQKDSNNSLTVKLNYAQNNQQETIFEEIQKVLQDVEPQHELICSDELKNFEQIDMQFECMEKENIFPNIPDYFDDNFEDYQLLQHSLQKDKYENTIQWLNSDILTIEQMLDNIKGQLQKLGHD